MLLHRCQYAFVLFLNFPKSCQSFSISHYILILDIINQRKILSLQLLVIRYVWGVCCWLSMLGAPLFVCWAWFLLTLIRSAPAISILMVIILFRYIVHLYWSIVFPCRLTNNVCSVGLIASCSRCPRCQTSWCRSNRPNNLGALAARRESFGSLRINSSWYPWCLNKLGNFGWIAVARLPI